MLKPRFRDPDGKRGYFRGQYVLSVYSERMRDRFSDGRYPECVINIVMFPIILPTAYALTFHPESQFYLEKIKD